MSRINAIALSGLRAASLRIGAGAGNIANARSNGPLPGVAAAAGHPPAYDPVEVIETATAGGGALARVTRSAAGALAAYDPAAPYADGRGMVAAPNVDLPAEMLNLVTASKEFAAYLAVLRADADLSARLLDIRA